MASRLSLSSTTLSLLAFSFAIIFTTPARGSHLPSEPDALAARSLDSLLSWFGFKPPTPRCKYFKVLNSVISPFTEQPALNLVEHAFEVTFYGDEAIQSCNALAATVGATCYYNTPMSIFEAGSRLANHGCVVDIFFRHLESRTLLFQLDCVDKGLRCAGVSDDPLIGSGPLRQVCPEYPLEDFMSTMMQRRPAVTYRSWDYFTSWS